MSGVSPTDQGGIIPPEPNNATGKSPQGGQQPQNTLQTEILQVEALLQSGNKNGAIQEIDKILSQLGSGTLANEAAHELLAAKSAIEGGASLSNINTFLKTAYNLLGPSNIYQSIIQQIKSDISEGNGDSALQLIYSLMSQVHNSEGPPSIVQAVLHKLAAAASEIQGGAPPSAIMSNLNDAYALLSNL